MVRNWIYSKTAELASSMNECRISHVYQRVILHFNVNKMFKVNFMLTLQWHLRVILCSTVSSSGGGAIYFKCTLTVTRVEARPRGCGLRPKQNPGYLAFSWPCRSCVILDNIIKLVAYLSLSNQRQNIWYNWVCILKSYFEVFPLNMDKNAKNERKKRRNVKWHMLSPKQTRKQHNQTQRWEQNWVRVSVPESWTESYGYLSCAFPECWREEG